MEVDVQILGSASARSNHLTASTEASARRLGLDYEIKKVTDLARISGFGIVVTPALLPNETQRASGRIPRETELDMLPSPKFR